MLDADEQASAEKSQGAVQVRFVFGRNVKFGELIKGFKHTRILV
jgi:hypothetical protein